MPIGRTCRSENLAHRTNFQILSKTAQPLAAPPSPRARPAPTPRWRSVRAVVGVITAADERPITNRTAVLARVRGALEHGCGNLLALCLAWLDMPQEAALSCGHALALQPHSRPALLLQAGLAGLRGDADVDRLSREQLDGLLAVDRDTARSQERLLPEVLLWIRSRSIPAPIALDRF